MATAPDTPAARVRLAAPGEVRAERVLTPAEERFCEQSVPAAFTAQARRTPDRLALDGETGSSTYGQLERESNQVATGVLEGLGPGSTAVGLLLEDAREFLVALLGVLKAGKLAVPLDPRAPPAVRDAVLQHSRARLVIVGESEAASGSGTGHVGGQGPVFGGLGGYQDGSEAHLDLEIAPGADGLLLYSSGSTGEPKAISRPHRAMLHHAITTAAQHEVGQGTVVGLLLSPAFGTAYGLAFAALLTGGTLLRYHAEQRTLVDLPDWLARHAVEVASVVPSMLGPLVTSAADEGLPSLRYLTAGSERLTRANAAAIQRLLAPDAKLVQTYGSTEAARICINVLEDPVEPGDSPLPVGVAVAGKRVQVLAPDGSPVGPGATGEIVITSRYLSYYWDPASAGQGAPSTEERAAAWTLRTGDLGMIDDDGLLVLLGREDRMVKIRGHRVELDMVERALLALDLVHEAVVLDEPGGSDTRRLVAHVVLREPASPGEIAHLRRVLATRLPAYMVPSRIVVLEELPLLPNGKVDVRGLAAASASSAPDGGVPALSETLTESEELLVGIWSSALECERVGREEDFFELGGDSLTAAVIAAGVHHAFGVELELSSFTNAPNVATMAPLLDELRVAGETWERPALTRVPREQPLPLSYAQERTWQISRTPEKSAGYVMARRLLIEGRLDLDALRRSVDHIVRRHETLRSSFSERDGQPVQVVHPPAPVNLPVDDFSASHDPEARSAELLLREARMPFDLEQGPLLRLRLVRIGDARYHLLRVHHHIIADAWSWMVFYRELGVLYEAYHAGDPPPLPDDLPVQYSDFAVWERGYLRPDSPRYQRDLAWWRRLFQDAPPTMPLPFRRAEPCLSARPADGLIWWGLPTEVSRGLDRVGRRVGATFFMVRLAVFAAALALDTNSQDVILGVYMTNRRRAETQAMFGLFANLVTLRLEFGRSLTFCDWLARVRSVVIETSCRAEIPYAQLSEQLHRDGSPPPEIRTIFGLADQAPVQRFGDLEITGLRPSFPVMPWEFSLTMDRWLEADGCSAVFDARVHDPDGVRSFIAGFQHLAGAVAAHPDRLLGSARI